MWALGSINTDPPQRISSKEKASEGSLEIASDASTLESLLPTTVSGTHSGACASPKKSSDCSKLPSTLTRRGENNNMEAEHRNLPRFPYVDNLLSAEALVELSATVDNFADLDKSEVGCCTPESHLSSSHRAFSMLNLLSLSDNRSDDQLSHKGTLPLGHDGKYKVLDSNKHCFVSEGLSTDKNKNEGDSKNKHKCGNTDAVAYNLLPNQLPVSSESLKRSPPPFFSAENKSTSIVFLCCHVNCCDAQKLTNATNSIGGHHFSIAHGGVFMKEACSWREENFYEMLAEYQVELVKEKVRRQSLKSCPERGWNEGSWKQYCDYEHSRLKNELGMDSSSVTNLNRYDCQDPNLSIEVLRSMQRAAMRWWRADGPNNDDELHGTKSCEIYDNCGNQVEQEQRQMSESTLQMAALNSSGARNVEGHAGIVAEHEQNRYTERHHSLRLLARYVSRFYGVCNLIKRQTTAACCRHRDLDELLSAKRHTLENSTIRSESLTHSDPLFSNGREIEDEAANATQHVPEASSTKPDHEEVIQTTSPVVTSKTTSARVNSYREVCSSCMGPPATLSAPIDLSSNEYKISSPREQLQMELPCNWENAGWVICTSVPNTNERDDAENREEKRKACRMIVLEDVCHGFKYPCMLDVKIGSRQYGLNASSVKKASKEYKSRLSTSAQYHIRLAGIKMWDAVHHKYVAKTKLYCRTLSLSQVKAELSNFLLHSQELGRAFRRYIEELRGIMQRQKAFRFYTSSLLFIYDAARAVETARIIMVDFAYTYERWELVEGKDPDAVYAFDEGYIKALDTLISMIP